MFRHLSSDDLKVLQDRANTSAGSNLEVMLGLALAFLRIELNNEVAERARVDNLPAERARPRKGEQTTGAGQAGGAQAPSNPTAGEGQALGEQSSGGAAS